jgi:hypothetical protein
MAQKELTLFEKLSAIQVEFKANKSRYNSFGRYNFRSAEDILEGLKPFNEKYKIFFTIREELSFICDNVPVIISTATIYDCNGTDFIEATAIVGVDLQQKGMQTPQAFGSASSYGKKYALGNLLLIDDTQDADATNTHSNKPVAKTEKEKPSIDVNSDAYNKAVEFIKNGGKLETILTKYNVSEEAKKLLKQL